MDAAKLEPIGTQRAPRAPAWHAMPVDQTLRELASHPTAGLSPTDAAERLRRVGPNALLEVKRRSVLAVFVDQFRSPLIYLLFVAAGLALVLGHRNDALVILVVVTINAAIGAFQEGRAERSLRSLRTLARREARVVRAGEQRLVDAREIVPGDILVLDAGDAPVADARLIQAARLHIAEAALTGESVPVAKGIPAIDVATPLADRRNMVYASTHVTAGRARAVVVATGAETEIGRIAALAETAAQPQTPLERRVAQFGRYIMIAAAPMFGLIVGAGVLRGFAFEEMLMVAISQLVGMIPEGLPVAMTIALAVGVQRMARRNVVVRRLAAVETLGSTSVICSDKTGTLTRNEMTVTDVLLPLARSLVVTGVGYSSEGAIFEDAQPVTASEDVALRGLLEAAALCNDAQLQAPRTGEAQWTAIGDPTEVALLTLAYKGGLDLRVLQARWPRRAELPFDSGAKLMATQHESASGCRILVKGAPEIVLAMCGSVQHGEADVTLEPSAREALRAAAHVMAERALRVLAIGRIEGAQLDPAAGFEGLRGRISLLGLIGQIDPPREEVKDAVARCRRAGIKPVVVTGDHKATGHAIALALGIAEPGDQALDGCDLERMSDAELAKRIEEISVFARVHPEQKLRIVAAYQKRRQVVAMTGDGVNDAPALVQADVGVAMGITGTEVAKESAKIVIGDDNFASIVAAVEEGRVVYRNIKKAVLLLFSTSVAEAAVLLLAILLGYRPPFSAVQILWINLVTESLITVNLVMEPAEGDEMTRPPSSADDPLLDRVLLTRVALMAPTILAVTLGWFVLRGASGVAEAQLRTESFTLLAICDWWNVLNCRSESRSALRLSVLRNRWLLGGLAFGVLLQLAVIYLRPLGEVFHTVPLDPATLLALAGAGSAVLWVEELRKLCLRRSLKARAQPADRR